MQTIATKSGWLGVGLTLLLLALSFQSVWAQENMENPLSSHQVFLPVVQQHGHPNEEISAEHEEITAEMSTPFTQSWATAAGAPLTGGQISLDANGYPFPGRAEDLPPGALWQVNNDHYDLVVVRYDQQAKNWTTLKPGASATNPQTADHLSYGLPIYAMAAGEVVTCWRNAPDNPPDKPHAGRDGCGDADEDGQLCEHYGQCSCTIPQPGNHLNVLTSEGEMILYAHLQPGSIPAALCPHEGQFVNNANDESGPNGHNPDAYIPPGARPQIGRGQRIGLVGHSGASSRPHLHNHLILYATRTELDLAYYGLWVQPRQGNDNITPTGWQKLNGAPLSIDPPHLILPNYSEGMPEIARHGLPASAAQFPFEHITQSGYTLAWIDAFSFQRQTYFNLIFRPSDGNKSAAFNNLSGSEYQAKYDEYTDAGYRLTQIESYLVSNQIRYAAIFVKDGKPAPHAYHGLSAADHQTQFDALTQSGWRPINISVVSLNGARSYAALYQKTDIGSYVAKSFLTAAEYQTEFTKNQQAGRQLAYLNSYEHEGRPYFTAIWNSVTKGKSKAKHGLSGEQYQKEWEDALKNALLTRVVTAYSDGGVIRYAAVWRE